MTSLRRLRFALAAALVVIIVASVGILLQVTGPAGTRAGAYFANSNGVFAGDEVRVLGVPVGQIERIEPEPNRAKVTFKLNRGMKVPEDVNAVIISPSLVPVRAVQLTPAYTGGPALADGAVIPQERTAVPVVWDELRVQLQRLTETLQPTQPGGVSTAGEFINTAADNLRGRGASIRDTLTKLSHAVSVLGDHSADLFGTVENVSILVSALESSEGLMRTLNQNFAAVTRALADQPAEVGRAIGDINAAVDDVTWFVDEHQEALGTTSATLASVSTAVQESLEDVKQALHVSPNAAANFLNVYNPAQAAVTGSLSATMFSNPIQFICGAVQAASRLGAEQAAKLCVQYLAPIVKNRQWNFPPLGANPLVGAQARPNERTYSEDWLRPDYIPPSGDGTTAKQAALSASPDSGPPAAEVAPTNVQSTDPDAGLEGMMLPGGGGS